MTCLFYGCARPVAPNGGPKDERPPGIDSTRTTPNLQTNFQKQPIKLTFDEWVVLKDANTQVLISPPVEKKPSITLKGRTVTFDFDKSTILRENTTYTINFGAAIQDLTEGNPAKDMRFVFSTGPVLDSLSYSGKVVDAFTGAAVKDVTVMLYDSNQPDSALQKGLPYYFSKTDESGSFSLKNLAAGQYKLIAIEDQFPLMKWNGERIAFLDSLVTLPDSSNQIVTIRMSEDEIALEKVGEGSPHYGLTWLAYSSKPDSLLPIKPIDSADFQSFISGDTIYVWHRNALDSTWYFAVGEDTIKVRPTSSVAYFEENALEFAKPMVAAKSKSVKKRKPGKDLLVKKAHPVVSISQHPKEKGLLTFGRPLESLDTSLMAFVLDTLPTALPSIKTDSADSRKVSMDIPWKAGATYTLEFFPGAVMDWYGQANKDTLEVKFLVLDAKKLSTLEVTLAELNEGTAYWVELLKDGGGIQDTRSIVAQSDTAIFAFSSIPAIKYEVQITEDLNANQRWDGGSYAEKRQAERVFREKIESLKPDWEVKKRVVLGDVAGNKASKNRRPRED